MRKIIEGLLILEKYSSSELAAEHDIIYGGSAEEAITIEDRHKLENLGWFVDSESGSWAYYV